MNKIKVIIKYNIQKKTSNYFNHRLKKKKICKEKELEGIADRVDLFATLELWSFNNTSFPKLANK